MRNFSIIFALLLAGACQEQYVPPTPGIQGGGQSVKSPETLGQPLTPWTEGTLDIHFINTSAGECTFMIFPDGTQMHVDAAESHNATFPINSTSNTGIRTRLYPMK